MVHGTGADVSLDDWFNPVDKDGREITFSARARVDNETELGYLHHGGILPLVLRELIGRS